MRFQLTRPMRGATCEGVPLQETDNEFQLTRPMRGATQTGVIQHRMQTFQLTRPMRGATARKSPSGCVLIISTHTPHAGRDGGTAGYRLGANGFQLTRPMRGATMPDLQSLVNIAISTHTPHAGRDFVFPFSRAFAGISTHTPHAGRDVRVRICRATSFAFQLTRPMRGATTGQVYICEWCFISTHTPHAGRDLPIQLYIDWYIDFNSHAPCGARQLFNPVHQI